MARRILIVGEIHFVDENGVECAPQIEEDSIAVELSENEDPNVIGEEFLGRGYSAYTTLTGHDAERFTGKTYTTEELRNKWEVCTKFISYEENVWHEDGELQLFDSEEAAKAELDDHIETCESAVECGYMDEAPTHDEFVIRTVL